MASKLTKNRTQSLEDFIALLVESDNAKRTDHLLSGFYAGTVNGMLVTAILMLNATERNYLLYRLQEMGHTELAKRVD